MECHEITQATVALKIMQVPTDQHLRQRLFDCIYLLFHGSFLQWILKKYNNAPCRQELFEDAKDAFQNGVSAFYLKAQEKEFTIKGSLKTTIYSFGLLQLLAFFKKGKRVYRESDYLRCVELIFEDDLLENERQELLNEKENYLLEALAKIPEKQRDILLMKFVAKLKSKQIAEILHVSVGNVDNESTKAYKELRNILKSRFSFQKQRKWH